MWLKVTPISKLAVVYGKHVESLNERQLLNVLKFKLSHRYETDFLKDSHGSHPFFYENKSKIYIFKILG